MEESNIACYNSTNLVTIAIIDTISSILSLLICLLVIATIIGFKKYVLFPLRLALYVCITAVLFNTATAAAAKLYFPMNESFNYNAYCTWSGYAITTTTWMLLLADGAIMVEMFLRVVHQKCSARYELLYAFVIFGCPLLISCIPFIENSYGQAGPWCWIRTVNNDSNCTSYALGIAIQSLIGFVPGLTVVFASVIIYILIVRHLCRNRYTGKYDPQKAKEQKLILKEANSLIIFPAIFVALTLLPLINKVASYIAGSDQDKILPVWAINAALNPFLGALSAAVFGINSETIKRIFRPYTWKRKTEHIEEYHTTTQARSDSLSTDEDNLITSYVEQVYSI